MFLQCVGMALIGIVVGLVKGYHLCLVILAVAPIMTASMTAMTNLMQKQATEAEECYSKAGVVTEEALGSIKTVTAFGGQQRELARYDLNIQNAKVILA